jgi:hypothetical protein
MTSVSQLRSAPKRIERRLSPRNLCDDYGGVEHRET